ncbi:MAG: hypothetical protein ACYC3I_21015 [Gemmataceae bacterium]
MLTDTQWGRSPIPALDFAKFAFPSDKITLAELRRVHPKEFDTCGRNFFDGPKMGRAGNDWPQEVLSEMVSIERMIARLVFESVCWGKPQASVRSSRWEDDVELIEALSGYYARYGVAHDRQESLRLIGSIEEQAAKQAEQLLQSKRDGGP